MTDVISIQSQVVHGHVGNSAAVFPLQASRLEVAAIPTVLLSNHPRYPSVHGRTLAADLVAALLHGVEERGLIESARVILTGYLGSVENRRRRRGLRPPGPGPEPAPDLRVRSRDGR